MPEASFYILKSQSILERYQFACKLIEKAYRNGHCCYVFNDTSEQSRIIDDLLWTFRQGSFVPHQLYKDAEFADENIVLVCPFNAPENRGKTLVNLASQCPRNFQRSERILEILDNSEESKESGRNRYRQYQQSGITIITHKID